jgi:site-specific DNA-methyltransferase (adenine-specific)
MEYKLICGNSLEVLKTLEENSIDSIVTDPPYELGFMGKSWDSTGIAYNEELWSECFRVLKPGGHLIAFSGSRTYHRMAVAIENSKFEIRDQMMWLYGSGFPKSLNISKAIDKKFGAEREKIKTPMGITGNKYASGLGDSRPWMEKAATVGYHEHDSNEPSTEEAKQWDGWGTALKPAHEPMVLARKPLSENTVAENVLKWGVGGLNIDGCRVGSDGGGTNCNNRDINGKCLGHKNAGRSTSGETFHTEQNNNKQGRWPANLIHDGSEEVESIFPYTKSGKMTAENNRTTNGSPNGIYGKFDVNHPLSETYGDSGSASRFFYCAKASKKDRNDGCEDFEVKANRVNAPRKNEEEKFASKSANNHPTVKPTDLMAYLCRLITPPNGTVLDPFNGSGSTGKACAREGFDYIGIDLSQEYLDISKARIQKEKGE